MKGETSVVLWWVLLAEDADGKECGILHQRLGLLHCTYPARPSPTLLNASGLGPKKCCIIGRAGLRFQIAQKISVPPPLPICPHAQSIALFRHVAIIGAQGRFAPASAVAGESLTVEAAAPA